MGVRGDLMARGNGKGLEDSWLKLEGGNHDHVKVPRHHRRPTQDRSYIMSYILREYPFFKATPFSLCSPRDCIGFLNFLVSF